MIAMNEQLDQTLFSQNIIKFLHKMKTHIIKSKAFHCLVDAKEGRIQGYLYSLRLMNYLHISSLFVVNFKLEFYRNMQLISCLYEIYN